MRVRDTIPHPVVLMMTVAIVLTVAVDFAHWVGMLILVSPVLVAARHASRRRRPRRFRRASLPEWLQATALARLALRRPR